MTGKQETVYIVDDDESAIKPIAKVLEAIGLHSKCYSSAKDFLGEYRPEGPACLVLDVIMPEMSGVVLQEKLAEAQIRIPTVVISGHADVRLAVEVMRNGALNFLEKPFRMQELSESIQEGIRLDRERWRQREEEEELQNRLNRLKPGESEVLNLVLAGRTNKSIASELEVSVRTIENRRARVMTKLGVASRAELLDLLKQKKSLVSLR